jgi:methionyl-tRNA synthetase
MDPIYITTSIVYPNANPHIGYAMELVQADFFARYFRLAGHPVRFLTGTDEHGLKIQQAAQKQGVEPQKFVDDMAVSIEKLSKALNLSHDRFIRTTDADHVATAQALWQMCSATGDIYKKSYKAWYNSKEEEFLGLVEDYPDSSSFGIDPRFIQLIDEENYFFALSRYKDQIVSLLTSGDYKVWPAYRAQELLNFVQEKGLQDISISREKSKLEWGIPVPGDDSQVMYVWFDALANYLTASSCIDERGTILPDEYWPAFLHCVGKDISRFHGLIWPGMLLSAGLPLPHQLLVHGFITASGQKMSKSIGNGVDPFEVLDKHGVDALRWYVLKEISTFDDGDFTPERFEEVYNADLANDLGNLVSRVWGMVGKYAAGTVPEHGFSTLETVLEGKWHDYHAAIGQRNIQTAVQVAHSLVVLCNKRIDEVKPWVLAKDPEKESELSQFLYELLEVIRHTSLMLAPALPITSYNIWESLFPNADPALAASFKGGSHWGELQSGLALGPVQPMLFPKDPRP